MKDFDSWNTEKKNIHDTERTPAFHEREIWWCSIGLNVGGEQDGKNTNFERPVLVIKKFNNKLCWVLPMSTVPKVGIYYHNLEYEGIVFSVILSQLRLVSVKRFNRFVRKISTFHFSNIKNKLINLLR